MNHLDLFSGILGFALSAYSVWGDDYNLIATCEIDRFCQKVIEARTKDGSLGEQNKNVPIISDIKDCTYETVMAYAEKPGCKTRSTNRVGNKKQKSELSATHGGESKNGTKKIDLITGGFPCQPFSVAGKRRGAEDDRAIWPQMYRVIKEVRPGYVIAENVTGIIRMELDNCLSDLEAEGYATETFVLPACAVDAPHRRDRVWVVANKQFVGRSARAEQNVRSKIKQPERSESEHVCEDLSKTGDVADTAKQGLQKRKRQTREIKNTSIGFEPENGTSRRWLPEPDVGRVAHGIPQRVDRLKSLGNAIVPQVVVPIMQAIKELDANE